MSYDDAFKVVADCFLSSLLIMATSIQQQPREARKKNSFYNAEGKRRSEAVQVLSEDMTRTVRSVAEQSEINPATARKIKLNIKNKK